MASLPSSVAVNGTLKLDSEFRKQHSSSFFSVEKNSSFANQKSQAITHLERISEPRHLDFHQALSLIKENKAVDPSPYIPLLEECINRNSALETEAIHAHIIKKGIHEELFLMTFLVNVYAKCGNMEYARKVFDNLPRRNVVAWTTLMTGYVHQLQPQIAIEVFLEMLDAGAYPTNYTLGIVLNACTSSNSTEFGRQIHAYIIKYHLHFDTSIGNSLSSFYSKTRKLKSAIKSFKRIQEKNVISWTAVISACGENGAAEQGLSFFAEMLAQGIEPNEFTFTSVLSLCCVTLTLGLGAQIHSLSLKLGYESRLPIRNSVMYLYLKCGWIHEAYKVFEGMEVVNLVTWNSMIAGYAKMMDSNDLLAYQYGNEALNIFLKLHRSNIKPDLFTFSSVLTVCSSLVALEQGEQVHAQTIKTGFLSDVVVGTALVNMYTKCGSIEKACRAFLEMSTRTLISWTSMITGFSQYGRSQQALQLFEDMLLAGVRPNQVTFVGVLSACSHAGMVEEAFGYFNLMQKEYNIRPVMDHFACMIDMLVRLGWLDEAFDFITKMGFEPNECIWKILVAGCRIQGNLELGFYAAEQLLKLKPRDTETYVSLLNMYLSAERYTDVSRVRKQMKEEKLEKLNDWSWISIKNKVYSFKPNDKSHYNSKEMYELLENLLEEVKNLGYESVERLEVVVEEEEAENESVERLEVVVEEEEAENEEKVLESTVHHSEKLAVAFGLLKLPNAAQIRVIKSTTMCGDCHSFLRFVSVLTAREIIIRDGKRLHQFVNGQCSCGDSNFA